MCIDHTSIPVEAPLEARNRETYTSFGEDGVTASANAYGHLLQITRYFGNEPSGFFCVDLPDTSMPNCISFRKEDLEQLLQTSDDGMRLRFGESGNNEDWEAVGMPKRNFIRDRWPLFTTVTPRFNLDIWYHVSNGTVYQVYTFNLKEESRTPLTVPILVIDANLLLRNLNFVENDDENNHKTDDTTNYIYHISNDGYSIIAMHKVPQTGQTGQDAVALFISLFINERPQTLEITGDPADKTNRGHCEVALDQQALDDVTGQKKLEITLAYRLDLVTSATAKDDPCPISHKDLITAREAIQKPFRVLSFTKDKHLNFILRRNLEHILSVCCIPVTEPVGDDSSNTQGALSYTEGPLIALTCGDISGHRIVTSASL